MHSCDCVTIRGPETIRILICFWCADGHDNNTQLCEQLNGISVIRKAEDATLVTRCCEHS